MALPRISDEQRRSRIGHRHLLEPGCRTNDLSAIADAVLALHSSDPVSVFLSVFARMREPSISAVERALYDTRVLIRHHAMRRTLWVMTPPVVRSAHASSTRKIAARERLRLLKWLSETPGIDEPETWLYQATEKALETLSDLGAGTTRDVGLANPDLTVPITVGAGTRQPTTVAAHSRILLQAGFEGRIVRTRPTGSWIASHYLWALAPIWGMPDLEKMPAETASDDIVFRWLESFGPGSETDIKWWTGWTMGHVRAALGRIGATKVELETGETGWISPHDEVESVVAEPWAALAPGLDPSTMGWKHRDWYLGEMASRLTDRNGNVGPTIWLNGRVVGGWAQRPNGDIATEIREPIEKSELAMIRAQVNLLMDTVGDTRFRVRFPPPNQTELLAVR